MENWFGILIFWLLSLCCLISLVVASMAAFGVGLGKVISGARSASDETEGPVQRSLTGPIILMTVGGLSLICIVCSVWKINDVVRHDTEAREIIECQEVFLAEHYRLDFTQRREGPLDVELQEFSIEESSMSTPAGGIVQFDVVDHYLLGEQHDGYWFLIDLEREDSVHYFPSKNDLLMALPSLNLTRDPELRMSDQYCQLNDCQPCSMWPYVTPTPR